MKRSLFFVATFMWIGFNSFLYSQDVLRKAIPAGAIKATPNIIYSAGGPCVFYDALGNILLNITSTTVKDPAGNVLYTPTYPPESGWSATPANAAWVVVTPTNGGYTEYPNYTDYANYTGTKYAPTCNFNKYMKSFWLTSNDTIYNEFVLLKGDQTTSKLLFVPSQIISVTNYDGSKTFTQGTDYTISGRTITQVGTAASAGYKVTTSSKGLSCVQATSWTCVTYIPNKAASGWGADKIFTSKTSKLPKTVAKLQAGQPLVIEAFGMSITAGLNVSGFAGDVANFTPTKPYMHSYIDLFAQSLQTKYGSQVTVINGSCGGKTAEWCDAFVPYMVTPNNPDLVLLDHGMNDIWSSGTNYATFRASMQSAINKIKSACPNAEIILINNMLPGTGAGSPGTQGPVYMRGLRDQLQSLEGTGVVNFPMTQMCDTIYARKGNNTCLSNSLHPNDYLARCYATGLAAMYDIILRDGIETDPIVMSDFMSVTPNPVVDGHLIIELVDEAMNGNATISIFDVSGKQVSSFKQTTKSQDYQTSSLNIDKGMYIFKAIIDKKVSTKKVIVK